MIEMAAIAARNKAAIVLSSEEKLHLTNIARLHTSQSVRDRATILLCLSEMRYVDAVKNCKKSQAQVSRIKKEWFESKLTGSDRINEICSRNSGRKKNDATLQSRMSNVLQFNRRLNPEIPRHARSQAIVEMARKEGMEFSISTVTRFLKKYEQEQIANM